MELGGEGVWGGGQGDCVGLCSWARHLTLTEPSNVTCRVA